MPKVFLNLTCAGHGYDGPVQGLWEGVEHGVGLVLLQGVPQPSEDEHPHADRHRQQQQLPDVDDDVGKDDDDIPDYLWLFLSVVPSVLRPVMWRESLKILRILRILKICAALAIYSREYCEDSWLRRRERKKGRIPRRSITFKNDSIKSN